MQIFVTKSNKNNINKIFGFAPICFGLLFKNYQIEKLYTMLHLHYKENDISTLLKNVNCITALHII